MSAITGIGISILLIICVSKILSFYDISMSIYGPYLAFLVFLVLLTFILPHDFSTTTVNTTSNLIQNSIPIGTSVTSSI